MDLNPVMLLGVKLTRKFLTSLKHKGLNLEGNTEYIEKMEKINCVEESDVDVELFLTFWRRNYFLNFSTYCI